MDNFFYNLNKKMSDLAQRQDLAESAVTERDMGKHNNATTGFKALAKKVGGGEKGNRIAGAQFQKMKKAGQLEETEVDEGIVGNLVNRGKEAYNTYQSNKELSKASGIQKKMQSGKLPADAEQKVLAHTANAGSYADKASANRYNRTGSLLPKDSNSGKGAEATAQARFRQQGLIKEGSCPKCDCAPCQCNEGNAFSGAVAKAKADGVQPGEKINVGGKQYPVREAGKPMSPKQKSFAKLAPPADKITFADKIAGAKKEVDEMLGDVAATAMKNAVAPRRNQDAMAGKQELKRPGKEHPLKNVAKGLKAFVQGKEEPMDEEKTKEPRSKGTAFDPDYQAQAKKEKEGTGNFDKKKISTGTVYTRKHKDDEEDEVKSDQPKAKGRPKGPAKGPERVTGKAWKHKGGRAVKENDIAITDRGEYDDEAGMAKDQLHTIVRHARELERALGAGDNLPEWVQEKMGQIKGMMTSVTDYMLSQKERHGEESSGIRPVAEKSKSQSQARMMAGAAHNPKFAKKVGVAPKVAKEFNKADKGKDISKLPNKVKKTDEDSKPDFLDMDKDGNKKEPMKKAVADKKEKKVAETTTSGSVATATDTKKSSGGMQFGKGVYEGAISESYDKKLSSVLNEGMNVTVTMNNRPDGGPNKTINVTADGDDAEKLAEILKLAGLGGQSSGCSSCGQAPCGCDTVDEAYGDTTATKNSPDWPTDKETTDSNDPYLRRLSGGLNGPKSTGQTTIPVLASQVKRQDSMEESVALERSLFNTWKNYKG